MAKYGHGGAENLERAEEAFLAALEINPELATAHNLFAYYEIEELGRPQDALARLLKHARRAPTNPDLLAGLVLACRFCGLLDASLEADRRARRLDPALATSVAYTHWMRGDYEAAMLADDEDMRWIHHYSLPMLGRIDEAIASCRQIEARTPRQLELDMLISTRAALEKDVETCVTAVRRVFESNFHDPEGLYFEARNAVYVGELDLGYEILQRVVSGGLWCAESWVRDPWLEPLRTAGRLDPLLAQARQGRAAASQYFRAGGGERLLGALGPKDSP
jgi:tetratricopeptide (TPR) repeat protein